MKRGFGTRITFLNTYMTKAWRQEDDVAVDGCPSITIFKKWNIEIYSAFSAFVRNTKALIHEMCSLAKYTKREYKKEWWRMPTKDTNSNIFSPIPSFELHEDDAAASVCVLSSSTQGVSANLTWITNPWHHIIFFRPY